jgi:hypothetical protein
VLVVRRYHTAGVVETTVQILFSTPLHLLGVVVVGQKPILLLEKMVVLVVAQQEDSALLAVLVTHLLLHRHRVTTAVPVQKTLIIPVEAVVVLAQ